MNNVHFQVHKLAINRVLGWSMEVRLQAPQVRLFNVIIEEVDGRRLEVVLVVVQHNLVLHGLLLVNGLVLWNNFLIVKFEVLVLEILLDRDVSLQIDWRLLHSPTAITLAHLGEERIQVSILELTRSFGFGVPVVFGIVIVMWAIGCWLAIWHATNFREAGDGFQDVLARSWCHCAIGGMGRGGLVQVGHLWSCFFQHLCQSSKCRFNLFQKLIFLKFQYRNL